MDRKRKKRVREIRVIFINIFMALSVVALVSILTLIAMGYSFDAKNGLKQDGLVEITSTPSGATVEIDGETKFNRTKINTMLSSGLHSFKVTKNGYDIWQRDLNVESGLLTNINWIRLFPTKPETARVKIFQDLRLVSFSEDRKNLFILEKDSSVAQLIDLQRETVRTEDLDLTTILDVDAAQIQNGSLSVSAWSRNSSKLILDWTQNDEFGNENIQHYLVDLKNPDDSINLSTQFSANLSQIVIANDSASKLWVIDNQNLRSIDISNLTISSLLAEKVEQIAANHDTIAILNTDKNQRAVRILKEGESGTTTIKELKNERISLATGSYWSDDWLAIAIDGTLHILSGKYPSYDKPSNSNVLETLAQQALAFTPENISLNAKSRIVFVSAGPHALSYDIETKSHFYFESTSDQNFHWLDDFLLWQNHDNSLVVRDFDGYNRRELLKDYAPQFGTLLTDNDDWLYYFTADVATDVDANTGSNSETTSFTLNRLKLKI